jgi:outer membrane protein, heavy metal efflux system
MQRTSLWTACLALAAACAAPRGGDASGTRAPVDRAWAGFAPAGEERDVAGGGEGGDETPVLGADADLGTVLALAERSNPGLQAAFHRWQAALERVPQSRALPRPRLTLAGFVDEVETRTGPMQARVGLTQPVPWFGRRGAAADAASSEADAAREELEAARLDLVQRVRDAWYELAWLERAIAIAAAHQELIEHWEEVALARFETGGSHADVIRAQVELGDLENRLRSLKDMRRPIAARINAALDRPAAAELPPPGLDAPPLGAVDGERLAAGLDQTSPHLRALRHRVEAAGHDVDLARRSRYPDLAVGAEYTFIGPARSSGVSGSGDDALALTLGIELPLWGSADRARVRESRERETASERSLAEARNELAAELEEALFRLRDADRRVGLYRDSLIPKGEESVEALSTAYESGDKSFLDLIDAERVLLEFQLQAARAEADRAQALARLERVTGVRLR